MRVFLADDRTKVRLALRLLLEQEPGLIVVGEADEAENLLAQVQAIQPDLVLLDWELPGLRASELLLVLHSLSCSLKVIALSGHLEACEEALAAGADAFVSKGDPPERLLDALRAVGVSFELGKREEFSR
ncbi:MAG: hypothetical protein DRJ03_28935 [Chloroflexi bacterium]|nr:MAG: hypothetical protein DRJ03_28935 [Chloroflexota bacterium]